MKSVMDIEDSSSPTRPLFISVDLETKQKKNPSII